MSLNLAKETACANESGGRSQNSGNKYVTRYRRTKNLVKKCSEISKQCDLDIILVMRDRKNDRIREVHTSHQMNLDDLNRMLQNDSQYHTLKYRREYAGDVCQGESQDDASSGNSGKLKPLSTAVTIEIDKSLLNDLSANEM